VAGNYSFTLSVKDSDNQEDTFQFDVNVINVPPTIESITIPSLYSTSTYPITIQVPTSDYENDPLTLTLSNNPSFLSLNQNTLTFTAPPSSSANYSFDLSLSDTFNVVASSYSFSYINTAPVLNIPFTTPILTTPTSGIITKAFTVTDADNNSLIPTISPDLSWISMVNYAIVIDSSVPIEGNYSFTLSVKDSDNQEDTFQFDVNVSDALGLAYSALKIEDYIPTPSSILSSNKVVGRFVNTVTDFTLPSIILNASIVWSSPSNYISFVGNNLIIGHPRPNQQDEVATLTATLEINGNSLNKDFSLVIRKKYIHTPVNQLFVLLSFTDVSLSYPQSLWSGKIFTNTKSLDNYFKETSGNVISINPIPINNTTGSASAITDTDPNDGIVEVNLGIAQPVFTDSGYSADIHAPALEILDPYIDFSIYDANNDGILQSYELNIVFITAGCEQATGTGCTSTWAHSNPVPAESNSSLVTLDGIKIGSNYTDYQNNTAFSRIATFGELHLLQKLADGTSEIQPAGAAIIAHEVGHNFLFLPDLYTPNPITGAPAPLKGIGYWGLMGSSWSCNIADNIVSTTDLCISDDYFGKYPQQFTPYSKMELDLIDPIIHNPVSNQSDYQLSSASVVNQPIVIPTSTTYHPLNASSTEYFVAEVKNTSGFDLGLRITGLRAPKLLISHIKPTARLKRLGYDYSQSVNDQLIEIERQTDSSNVWDYHLNAYTDNDYFSPTTTPNSNTRGGANTGITIDNIITNNSGNFNFRVTN
jgi:M6 family metalloprotease-like protein